MNFLEFLKNFAIIVTCAATLFFAGWFSGGEHTRRKMTSPENLISTDTTTTRVPIQDTPVLVDSVAVERIDPVVVPVIHSNVEKPAKTPDLPVVIIESDSTDVAVSDSMRIVIPDSARVVFPITSKIYETENYRAVVTGYKPELSEITIFAPRTTVRNGYVDTKRWRCTVGAQIGYGITPAGAQPYVGIGFTFGWTF